MFAQANAKAFKILTDKNVHGKAPFPTQTVPGRPGLGIGKGGRFPLGLANLFLFATLEATNMEGHKRKHTQFEFG
jgi:hypothetical protein